MQTLLAKQKKTTRKKVNPNEKMIHIAAVSDVYTVFEIVSESKAVERLTFIRNTFIKMDVRFKSTTGLKVKTCVHNPELF